MWAKIKAEDSTIIYGILFRFPGKYKKTGFGDIGCEHSGSITYVHCFNSSTESF